MSVSMHRRNVMDKYFLLKNIVLYFGSLIPLIMLIKRIMHLINYSFSRVSLLIIVMISYYLSMDELHKRLLNCIIGVCFHT